jgi:hypothetical protein
MADVKTKTGGCSARLRVRFREGVKDLCGEGVKQGCLRREEAS